MGKSCVRFKKLDDLALDVIGEAIKRVPARKYIEYCEAALKATKGASHEESPGQIVMGAGQCRQSARTISSAMRTTTVISRVSMRRPPAWWINRS